MDKVDPFQNLSSTTAGPPRNLRAPSGFFRRRHAQPYTFMLPAIALIALVSIYPIVYAMYISLFRTHYLERVAFVGLGNYQRLLADPAAWRNLLLSLVYVFGSLALVLPFGLAVAILLNQPVRFRSAFRAAIILPWIVSQTIIALLWGWLLNPDFGPAIYLLQGLGIGKVALLSEPVFALPTVICINVWGSYPLAAILLLAALQTIPPDLLDAAQVDGVSGWQKFSRITLPLIRPTLLVVLILLSLLYFNMVTLLFTLTGGGPLGSTEVLSLRTFDEAFQFWRVGYAASFGMVIFAMNVGISLLYIRLLGQEPLY